MTSKPYAESCERNRAPILSVLQRYLGDARRVLEIGSGTGQHAVYFAAAMPWLRWQSSDHPDHLPGIGQWLAEEGLPNTPPPIELQAVSGPSPGLLPLPANGDDRFDAIFTANTLHIMGWDNVLALFAGLPALMAPGALFLAYGPFNYGGVFSSDSNRNFDGWLKARDARSGIRDFEAVDALAQAQGLALLADVAMPANNRLLVWQRQRR
jgi:SAM-dependent methyltransferase